MFRSLIMAVVTNGCTKMAFPNWVQEILTGVIITIAAVVLDRLRHQGTTELGPSSVRRHRSPGPLPGENLPTTGA